MRRFETRSSLSCPPRAKQILADASPPPLIESEIGCEAGRSSRRIIKTGIQRIVRLIRYYLEKLLEDMTLVDDVGQYVEWVLYLYFEAKKSRVGQCG